ncbi:MAG: CoA transferase [Chloroflexi bacterium]|nr:CoA transferase [Chloroflexota bacterium]
MHDGLLADVRILDLTRFLAGPYATMLLGDLGADVIKIEEPGGDPIRRVGPPWVGPTDGADSAGRESGYFVGINKNKRSVCLDLTKPEGRAALRRLAASVDVVIENFRPGVAAKLGADEPSLRQVNDRLVYCSISGFGQTGPLRDRPGFDAIFQAIGGTMSVTGPRGGRPVRIGIPIGDLGAGLFAAFAISAALVRRDRTGAGSYLDLSALDCQIALLGYLGAYHLADGRVPGTQGTEHETVTPYGMFETADQPIIIACVTYHFFARLCEALGVSEWTRDPRFRDSPSLGANRAAIETLLSERLRRQPAAEILAALHAAGVPAAPVNDVGQALSEPQILERNLVYELDRPTAGRIKVIGTPVKARGLPDAAATPPPLLGEHTDAVLRELAGLSDPEIAALRATGVFRIRVSDPNHLIFGASLDPNAIPSRRARLRPPHDRRRLRRVDSVRAAEAHRPRPHREGDRAGGDTGDRHSLCRAHSSGHGNCHEHGHARCHPRAVEQEAQGKPQGKQTVPATTCWHDVSRIRH